MVNMHVLSIPETEQRKNLKEDHLIFANLVEKKKFPYLQSLEDSKNIRYEGIHA